MNDTRMQLHWAAQAAASVSRAVLSPAPDDSHTTFTWSNEHEALVQQSGAGIRIRDLALLWLTPFEACPLAGRTLEDGYRFFEERTGRTLERLGEGLPPHPVSTGAAFDPNGDDLARFSHLYAEAAAILEDVRANHPNACAVRCWPHHFDIATLIAHGGERTTGIGFVPGDVQYPDPYWYVTPWPYPDPTKLPPLPRGRWHTEGWVGAVHEAGERAEVAGFIAEAIGAVYVG